MVASPAVVGAVAVAGEGAAEVGDGEGGDLIADAHPDHEAVEVLERRAQLGKELSVDLGLIVVGIELPAARRKSVLIHPGYPGGR